MFKEIYDDFQRYKKDKEANSFRYICYIKVIIIHKYLGCKKGSKIL